MRIVAGTLKGRRLLSPSWDGLRPTSDRLRETLFNIVASRAQDARVLDAFAGTGAVGIEALSRGAAHVTFVESDRRAVELIRRNLAACRVRDAYTMIPVPFAVAVQRLEGAEFDLVLLDPPYAAEDVDDVVRAAGDWLAPGGWLVLEHGAARSAPEAAGAVERFRVVRAGDSALSFYRRRSGEGGEAGGAA